MSRATDAEAPSSERTERLPRRPRRPRSPPQADRRCQRQSAPGNHKTIPATNKTLASVNQPRQSCSPSVVADTILIDAPSHPDRRATPKLAPLYDAIHAQVQEHPDATISELQRWLQQTHHVSASNGLICETLALLGLTRKKRRSAPRSRTVLISPRHAANGATTSESWIRPG